MKENPAMKSKWFTALLILLMLAGLSLLLYPTVSDYWNSFHASRAIAGYSGTVSKMDREAIDRAWNNALAYNSNLHPGINTLTDEQKEEYDRLLNIDGTGIMGYIDIPAIELSLPIYHGTSDYVLQTAVGHVEWSSLPVGGEGSHCVISGHRGQPSAKLFTDIDRLREGDIFLLNILDMTLTYEVDQIRVVEPQENDELQIMEGKDYCTLVTCTPYGINTHRLLVRGHRVENKKLEAHVVSEAVVIDPLLVAPLTAVPLLLLLLLLALLRKPKKKKTNRKTKENPEAASEPQNPSSE